MAQDNIFNTKEDLQKVITGISKATSMIRGAYGPAGSNVIVEDSLYPYYRITNDGKLIVDQIHLEDPLEQLGAKIIKEVGDKAERDSGDGRKTTMILTEAILKAAQDVDETPMNIKRSLDACVPVIIKALDEQSVPITDVKAVATIASESEMIGTLLQEIYKEIGKDGIVEVDNSNLAETFYEITEGVRLRGARYISEYSNTEQGKAVYLKPKILITKDKITAISQLEPIITHLVKNGVNELVIFCDDIDMSVAGMLAATHVKGIFKTLLIKAPTLWKDWVFEDFAKITGATVIDTKEGKTFKNFATTYLGTCEKIITTREETRVLGIKDITEHINALKATGTDESKIRVSWLQTKVAVLKVGASSESELSYISKKAKDACNASYLALKEGVVPGAGLSMCRACNSLPTNTWGENIMNIALMQPMFQVYKNMGLELPDDISVQQFNDSIVDPLIVVKNAIINAISIAGTILTTKGVVLKHENI